MNTPMPWIQTWVLEFTQQPTELMSDRSLGLVKQTQLECLVEQT